MNPRLARALLTIPTVLLPIAILVPLPSAAAAEGSVFFVDSTEDGIDANPGDGVCATALGQCTLRAAVMEANALPTADRIELGSGVYYLSIPGLFEEQATTGDLDIYRTLTIVGQGMTLTVVDAGGAAMGDRALHIHPGAIFRLEDVSVFNADIGMGSNGAGLRNDSGNVVIQGASFQFSRAHNGAGLMNVGQMVIRNTLIGYNTATDSGAGVRNDGTLEIESSTLLKNEAQGGPGGAIENHGTLTIRNSTISNNRAGPLGGAIYNGYGPPGTGAALTINNSTIFANLALTGGSGEPATGGIYSVEASSVQLSNSILALNGVDYSADADCLGTITSRGYNLFSAVEACTLAGDLTGNIVTANPGLGTIIEEDPAHTASYPLLPGSPALEAGNPAAPGSSDAACEPVDQRGILRPQVARCDIGAREMEGTPPPSGLFFDGFETGDLSAWSSAETDQGDLSVSPGAALGGAYGLQADIDDNRSLYVVDTTPASEGAYAARFYFDPNSIAMASGNAHLLFKALDGASRSVYQIELRSYQGDYQIRAQALKDSGSATSTSWFRLHDDVHAIETIWQAASADGASDGSLTLWLDGELAASLAGLDNDTLRVESVRLGAVAGIDSGTRGGYFFDAFGSTAGGAIGPDPGITLPSPLPIPDAVFADGFESGDLSAWSAVTNGRDLSVSSSAALGGGFGLQAIVDDTAPRYVSDWSPVSLRSYASRFYFDPNSISMASGNSHVLFRALDFAAKTAFQIELRSYQGEYQIRAYAPWDSGGSTSTPWFRIHDDLHSIEAIWQASSAEGAMDGALTLWLDGELAASGSGIDNDTRRVDKVDLGAVTGLDGGTSGTYYFDAFASTSGNPLGTDPGITLPPPPATPEQIFDDGFESGDLSAWLAVTNGTDLSASSSAALVGGYGLEAIVDDTAPRYVSDWTPLSLKAYAARFYFDPNGISMASGNSHLLFKAVDAVSKTAFQLELRSFQGDYQIRAYAPWDSGGAYTSPWFRLSDDPHLLEVIWQAASGDGASDGWLSLSIDAESVASGSGLDNDTRRVDKVDLGAVAGIDSGTSGTYYFDAFASTTGIPIGPDPGIALPTPPSPADEIFADGFESGGLSAWSTRKNEGDLLVNNGSALAGGYGLEAIADDTAPRYVTDWSPVAEKEYHVRFVFDPNSLTMLDGRSHVIFQALSGSSKVIARVELRVKSLNYELRSGVLTDANQWVNTGWWYIDGGPQVIELDWRGARFPWSPDGSLTIWINEEQSENLDGIDNSLQRVDLAQLGVVAGLDSGTLGSMRFDAFESRRWGHIGLPDDLATPVPTGTPTGTLTTTPTLTPTLTPTPDCGNIAVNSTDILYSSYVRMLVTNQNPYPIHLTDSTISWAGPGLYPGQALGGMYFDGYYWIGNDPVSPSSHAPAPPIAVSPGATAPWYGYFLNAPALFGTYSVTLTFEDTCVVRGSVNRDPPTMTVTPTPTHTKTPAGTLGPSATFTPTPVPPGTATVTATPTAGAASCELIHIERFGYAWDRMFVKVVNNNAVPVSLTGSYIEWPDSGDGYLDWLEFGARYYEGDDPEPPTSVSLSPPIALAGDSSKFWIAGFPYGVIGWPEDRWDIELEFNDVCTVSLGFSILTPTPTWVP